MFARFRRSRGGHLRQDEDTLFEVTGRDVDWVIDDGESLKCMIDGLVR